MRNLGLDILRFAAVLLVLGRHLCIPSGALPLALVLWHRGGWIGVDLFFVLSGFLVSGLLFKEHQKNGAISARRFLIRRGFKIYPAFWALFLFSIPMKLLLGNDPVNSRAIIGEFFFLQNYLGGLWNHTWSLAVEEHFYLLFALLATVLLAKSDGRNFSAIPVIFVIVALSCLGLRIHAATSGTSFLFWNIVYPTHLRIDSLFFGVLLSYLTHYRDLQDRIGRGWAICLVIAGAGLLAPAFVVQIETTPWVCVYGVTLFYFGAGMLVLVANKVQAAESKMLRWAGMLGGASYSIYLWHVPINRIADRTFGGTTGAHYGFYLFSYLGGSILVGLVLGRLIEVPFLRFRDRIFPSYSGQTAVPLIHLHLESNGDALPPAAGLHESSQ